MVIILVKTIQNKKVLETLKNNKIHYAKPVNFSSLSIPYDKMMKHYHWNHTPIFGCAVNRYCDFYGAILEDSVILTLDVPDDLVKLQVYYDWTDIIYYIENPKEWKDKYSTYNFNNFIKNTLDGYRTNDPDAIIQVTMPYIKPEWLVKYEPITNTFAKKYYINNKSSILEQ